MDYSSALRDKKLVSLPLDRPVIGVPAVLPLVAILNQQLRSSVLRLESVGEVKVTSFPKYLIFRSLPVIEVTVGVILIGARNGT